MPAVLKVSKNKNRCHCSCQEGGWCGPLTGGAGRCGLMVKARRKLRWSALLSTSSGAVSKDQGRDLPLLLEPQNSWSVAIFSFCSDLLTAHECGYNFFVSYTFFVVCCPRRCSSRCKTCSKRSQDPGCLIHSWFHYPLSWQQTFKLFLQQMAIVNHAVLVTTVQVTPS